MGAVSDLARFFLFAGIAIASVPEKRDRPRGGGGPAQQKSLRLYTASWDKTVSLFVPDPSKFSDPKRRQDTDGLHLAEQIKLWPLGVPKLESIQTVEGHAAGEDQRPRAPWLVLASCSC